MSFRIRYTAYVDYVADGAGPMEAAGAQTLRIDGSPNQTPQGPVSGVQIVPGGNSPTGANFTTAATAIGTDLSNQLNVAAVLARVQAFSSGGA